MTMHGPVSRRMRLSGCRLVALGAWMCIGTAHAGTWQPVGVGDCPGRDVAGSRGPLPEAGKCDTSFAGNTAVWLGQRLHLQERGDGFVHGRRESWPDVHLRGLGPRARGRRVAVGGDWRLPGPGRSRHEWTQSGPDEVQCELRGQHGGVLDDRLHLQERGDGFVHGRRQPRPNVHLRCLRCACARARACACGWGWQSVGIGDCPGRDVAGTSGPNPDPAKCNGSFAGNTAVCWTSGCTYKNVATGSCTGGANPGQMYTCGAYAAPSSPPLQPTGGRNRRPDPGAPHTSAWQSVGIGDCPGRDVAGTSGPTPDPSKCDSNFAGNTAVCWATGCTYKNVVTGACTGGANPGQMYTCAANAALPLPPPAPPKVQGKRYSVVNYTGDTQNAHDFIVELEVVQGRRAEPGIRARNRGHQRCGVPPRQPFGHQDGLPNHRNWIQYDWVMLDGGATMAGSYRDPTTCGPSAGKRRK